MVIYVAEEIRDLLEWILNVIYIELLEKIGSWDASEVGPEKIICRKLKVSILY